MFVCSLLKNRTVVLSLYHIFVGGFSPFAECLKISKCVGVYHFIWKKILRSRQWKPILDINDSTPGYYGIKSRKVTLPDSFWQESRKVERCFWLSRSWSAIKGSTRGGSRWEREVQDRLTTDVMGGCGGRFGRCGLDHLTVGRWGEPAKRIVVEKELTKGHRNCRINSREFGKELRIEQVY